MLGTQGTESGKELVVDCMSVVEEGANDVLDFLDAFFGEWRTVGFVVGELADLVVDFHNVCEERAGAWWAWDACTWCEHCRYSLAWQGDMSVQCGLGRSSMLGSCLQSGYRRVLQRLHSVS